MNLTGLPMSFVQFAKEPVKAILLFCVIAIGYLYMNGRTDCKDQIDAQNIRIVRLESQVQKLNDALLDAAKAVNNISPTPVNP